MNLTQELESHPVFEVFLREVVRQLMHGVWTGGSDVDPEGFIREPFTGQLVYMEPHDLPGV